MLTRLSSRWLRIAKTQDRRPAGFTITELLVGALVGGFAVSGMLYLITSLVEADRNDLILTQTQQELADATEYIATEIREAAFVYPGECIDANPATACVGRNDPDTGTTPATDVLDGIGGIPTQETPVLVMWKEAPVPLNKTGYFANGTPSSLPNCASFPAGSPLIEECQTLRSTRHVFSLVVYTIRRNTTSDGTIWRPDTDGEARIVRREMPRYAPSQLLTLTKLFDNNPDPSDFRSWDCEGTCSLSQAAGARNAVLVSNIDDPTINPATDPLNLQRVVCPGFATDTNGNSVCAYSPTPVATTPTGMNTQSAFYAWVRVAPGQANPAGNTIGRSSAGIKQDVYLTLRGNASARANQRDIRAGRFMLTQSTIATTAGFADREITSVGSN
ncbi:MAG: hypothetical protein IGQ88_01235 [Gloeomargaritaceae cyanobacterium C42_A2020_066]|nr:hypothetical protein [Gloeomargaritaceae cyanobacterium C42_A2020_066]